MKGRKTDSEFLSSFITKCISQNKTSPEEIVMEAKYQVSTIDEKIREVEKLKNIRSKLLDVVSTFETPIKSSKYEEIKVLSFFKIQNQHICKFICDSIKDKTIRIDALKHQNFSTQDIVFCIKQLLEYKIVSKVGEHLLRGDSFNEYVKFVLKGA